MRSILRISRGGDSSNNSNANSTSSSKASLSSNPKSSMEIVTPLKPTSASTNSTSRFYLSATSSTISTDSTTPAQTRAMVVDIPSPEVEEEEEQRKKNSCDDSKQICNTPATEASSSAGDNSPGSSSSSSSRCPFDESEDEEERPSGSKFIGPSRLFSAGKKWKKQKPKLPLIRDTTDIRSPGACATPLAVDTVEKKTPAAAVTPDFITQTDRYGNAIQRPAVDNWVEEAHQNDDSYFDPLRVMCCCLSLDDDNGGVSSVPPPQARKKSPPSSIPSSPCTALSACSPTGASSSSSTLKYHLPPSSHEGKKCLVLDLDETLVHSSFRVVPDVDFIIPVQVDSTVHSVYVAKRPFVDTFLTEMAQHYEIVVYTASLNKYADPLLDLLDPNGVIAHRLFREHCVYHDGHYVKDLGLLNRPLHSTIIVDNSPNSYLFHPENAIDCSSFIDDPRDDELVIIGDFLKGVKHVQDVRHFCNIWRGWPNIELSVVPADSNKNSSTTTSTTSEEDEDERKPKQTEEDIKDPNVSSFAGCLIPNEWFV